MKHEKQAHVCRNLSWNSLSWAKSLYALDKEQIKELTGKLQDHLSIKALTIIATCNRTEIYFESDSATPNDVCQLFRAYAENLHHTQLPKDNFQLLDDSVDTANHLLHVANGLRSAVIGDKQIINQVKESYLTALTQHNQGSLLERAFQAVFRSNKRIQSESLYKRGSTSTAYSSLKMVENHFGHAELKSSSLLIVGAGEIAEDILKYLPKFHFKRVAISNRTELKAKALADR